MEKNAPNDLASRIMHTKVALNEFLLKCEIQTAYRGKFIRKQKKNGFAPPPLKPSRIYIYIYAGLTLHSFYSRLAPKTMFMLYILVFSAGRSLALTAKYIG